MNMPLHLLLLPATEGGEARQLHFDARGRAVPVPVAGARRVLVVPGQALLVRRLPPGPASEAQARAAAWHALKGELATPPERLAWEIGQPDAEEFRWVVAFDPALRLPWREAAEAHGFAPEAIVPACLLLPAPARPGGVTTWRDGALLHARSANHAFSVEADLADVVLAGRAREPWLAEDADGPWLGAGDEALPDLRDAPASSRDEERAVPGRRLAALAAAVLLAPVLVFVAQGLRHEFAGARLDADAETRLLAADPEADGPGRPLARAHASLTRRLAAQQPAPALAALLQAQAALPGTRLRSLSWGPDGVVELRWEHPAATPPPRLAEALAPHGYTIATRGSEPAGAFVHSTLLLGELP